MAIEYTEIFRVGDIHTLRELLDNGLDPNYTRFELLYGIETSLLKLAVFHNQFEMTKLLISRGADVNKISDHGRNILFTAVNRCHFNIIGLLISHGIDYNHKDYFGDTIFDYMLIWNKTKAFLFIAEIVGYQNMIIRENIFEEIISNIQSNLSVKSALLQNIKNFEFSKLIDILKVFIQSHNIITKSNFELIIKNGLYDFFEMFINYGYYASFEQVIKISSNDIEFKDKIKEFYQQKKNKADAIFAKTLLSYHDIPDVIRNQIVSFIY